MKPKEGKNQNKPQRKTKQSHDSLKNRYYQTCTYPSLDSMHMFSTLGQYASTSKSNSKTTTQGIPIVTAFRPHTRPIAIGSAPKNLFLYLTKTNLIIYIK